MDWNKIVRDILMFAPVFIISLSFHEFAHAWAANRLGDSTAKYMGRMTMDPMSHIDMFGTVIFPMLSIAFGGIFFGWANPVPVDMRNFRKPRQHMALVALAGPVSNVFLAFVCTGLAWAISTFRPLGRMGFGAMEEPLLNMVALGIMVNLTLALFNMIPLPPLDGSKVLQGFVPNRTADKIDGLAMYSQFILIALIFSGVLSTLLGPARWAFSGLLRLAGL